MKDKTKLIDRFKDYCSDHSEWAFVIFVLLVLLSLFIISINVSFYDSSAIVTAIGNEGVTVEYRDRKGTLRSDFMETSNEYSIGDEIIIHVDEWRFRPQKRVYLSDEDKE